MKIRNFLAALAAGAALAGCVSTRSISNSGQPESDAIHPTRDGGSDPAFAYRGELSEFDVRELQGVGHLVNLERPDEFNEILGEFVDSV